MLLALAIGTSLSHARADALDRLELSRLTAVHAAIAQLRNQPRRASRHTSFQEIRANLHVHSRLSHDSRGEVGAIVAAARAVGTRVILFTEHPSDRFDFVTDGHHGIRDGVLLIPGAETNGFLAFPHRSLRGLDTRQPQEFADLVRRDGGLLFLSHLEERLDWNIRGLTGTEIYNTHADFKDEKRLQKAMHNPLWLFALAERVAKYPQEVFSALQDYPGDYLRRWDQLCRETPHTGIAANDAHQNVGLVARRLAGNKIRLEDALGEKLLDIDAALFPFQEPKGKNPATGEEIFRLQLDPYECSLRHVGTHLLVKEFSEAAVREALEAGRAFVAFDWLADATGFEFAAHAGGRRFEMGSRLPWQPGLRLQGQAPVPGRWKVLRNGLPLQQLTGTSLDCSVAEPGIYRVEVWLTFAGEEQIWILSNPVYIR